MLLAMADVRAVLVALAARLARLRSAAALAGAQFGRCSNTFTASISSGSGSVVLQAQTKHSLVP
jgi:hypothetical protein